MVRHWTQAQLASKQMDVITGQAAACGVPMVRRSTEATLHRCDWRGVRSRRGFACLVGAIAWLVRDRLHLDPAVEHEVGSQDGSGRPVHAEELCVSPIECDEVARIA